MTAPDEMRADQQIPGGPVLTPRSFLRTGNQTVRALFAREVDQYTYYAYGKIALRDGLRWLGCTDGGNVLLPAYIPNGVVEPIRDLGLEPRFYAIESDLGPNLADLEARVDDASVAVLVVHYFGFPQQRLDELRELTAEQGIALIDDNAHSPFSRRGSRLLGTFGDIGFTSLRKVLPVPNGAVLLGASPSANSDSLTTPASQVTTSDLQFLASNLLQYARYRLPTVNRLVAALNSPDSGSTDSERDPEHIYQQAKTQMSKLAWFLTRTIDPETVVAVRRESYRAWLDLFDRVDGPTLLHDTLPSGVCPQVVPVVFDDASIAERFVTTMTDTGVHGVHTWPPLPNEVTATEYETATDLADRLVVLPCHQQLPATTVAELNGVVAEALTVSRRTNA